MNLDDPNLFENLDTKGMIDEIRSIPSQLEQSWKLGQSNPIPENKDFSHIIVAGMGGSAIGADILESLVYSECEVPVSVIRGYKLPEWARGGDVLVICSSHSGNTEETLSVFEHSLERNCITMAVTTGGQLEERCEESKSICWKFDHEGQPRAAVGYSFGLLYSLFFRLSLLSDAQKELEGAISKLNAMIAKYDVDVPVSGNLAKRLAGQAVNRFPFIIGAEHLEPVSRRWKTQVNELAKAWAQFEFIPEANHNTLAGVENPDSKIPEIYAIFLNSENYYPRNQKRMNLTFTEFMVAGLCTDKIVAQGKNLLEEIWTTILLGDFFSYYLAMAYKTDPTPVETLENFKRNMK